MVIDAIRVQVHSTYALLVARAAFPSERIALPCSFVERPASFQNILMEVGMTLY